MVTKDEIIEVIKSIEDPELNIDLWTLGLIYDIKIDEEGIDITMTLTSPLCPFADELVMNVEKKVGEIVAKDKTEKEKEGLVRVDITFDPPWKPSEELRMMLGV